MAGFLLLLTSGVAFLLAGLFLTRLHWREDIPPYGLRPKNLDIAARPGRYAAGPKLPLILVLNAVGAVLVAGALAWALYSIYAQIGS